MTTGKIRIISTTPGYRRGGISHPADRTYPAGHFTEEQLKVFRADPNLTVLDGDVSAASGASDSPDVAELRQALADAQDAKAYAVARMQENATAASEIIGKLNDEKKTLEMRTDELTGELDEARAEIATLKKAAEKKTGGK